MDIEKALIHMDITAIAYKSMTIHQLKRKFHIMALKNHPDKNKDKGTDINDNFIKLQEAYHFLSKHKQKNTTEDDFKPRDITYNKLLRDFIKIICPNDNSEILFNILLLFINKSITVIFNKLLNNINKDKLISIYNILKEYGDIFNINEQIYKDLLEAIETKYKNNDIIIINPTIKDLLEYNIYILDYKDKKYYIPLWHNELQYDKFTVKCIPDFIIDDNNNIFIDHLNNLHIKHNINLNSELLSMNEIKVEILNKTVLIPIDKLFIKKEQIYIIKNNGIPRINVREIYNIDNISDIILHIIFT